MGYAHLFYRVDLEGLKALFGSGQTALAREVLKKQADEVENLDLCFEDEIREGSCPDTKAALQDILSGRISYPRCPSMYGYVLKILCEQIGKSFGEEVGAVHEHPYESRLARSGPPIPIPYDPGNFPQIGFLAVAEIPAEIERIDSAPRTLKPPFRSLPSDSDLVRDMEGYRKTLEEARKKRADVISFRH